MSGQKIIDGLKDALAGNLAAVTIEGQRWVRADDLAINKAIKRFDRSGKDMWTGEAVAFELRAIANTASPPSPAPTSPHAAKP